MATGRVTATSLNLRDAPNGAIIGLLQQGDTVTIQSSQDGWLSVAATINGASKLGWVSAQFVATAAGTPAAAPGVPPPDTADKPVTVANGRAFGPDGRPFARAQGAGFWTGGITTVDAWFGQNPPGIDLSPSTMRVIRAVSRNEGMLEAINTYDDAFLSFGMFQWTAGTANGPGELAGLLALLQRTDAAAFQTYFGSYGLAARVDGAATIGFLALDGTELNSVAAKQQLRGAPWAYRFWRAGQDDQVRACEISLAAGRISTFIRHPLPQAGRTVIDWLSSEYGIALILDEHVNRPGHVPGTLDTAIARLGAGANPSSWGDADEARLIDLYIQARDGTNMTDSAARATKIADCVHAGQLSDQRGSFAMGVT